MGHWSNKGMVLVLLRVWCFSGISLCKKHLIIYLQRFLREAMIMRSLYHSNITMIMGASHHGAPCTTMPWKKNGTIVDFIQRQPSICREVCTGSNPILCFFTRHATHFFSCPKLDVQFGGQKLLHVPLIYPQLHIRVQAVIDGWSQNASIPNDGAPNSVLRAMCFL